MVGRERGRERGRTFGCGKMPSAHSLEQPRPAFERLCTCRCLSSDFVHISIYIFYFLSLELLFFEHYFTYCSEHSSTFTFFFSSTLVFLQLSISHVIFHNFIILIVAHLHQVEKIVGKMRAQKHGSERGERIAACLYKGTPAHIQTGDTPIGNRTEHTVTSVGCYQKGHETRCVQSDRHVGDKGHRI